jgi:hypothetical protein
MENKPRDDGHDEKKKGRSGRMWTMKPSTRRV